MAAARPVLFPLREGNMRLLLQALSLSDRYERKARLLPGLIAASPIAFTMAAVSAEAVPWWAALGVGALVEALVAFLLGYLARARGKAAEERMWVVWGGPPTTRWLRPTDNTCSDQQKAKWRAAIKRITGLTIPANTTTERNEEQVDRIVNDATRQLRYVLRDRPEATMVRIHNEEYGQARNLLGLRWYWAGLAAAALAGCIVLLFNGERPWLGLAVSSSSLLLALLIGRELPGHVRRCADRYAESFFAAVILYDDAISAANDSASERRHSA
jgi:hypothetical protein